MIISVDRSTGGASRTPFADAHATATLVEIIPLTAPGFGKPKKERRRVNPNA
jgi:hypothetical protein